MLFWLQQKLTARLSISRFQRRKEDLWKLMGHRGHVSLVQLEELIEKEQASVVWFSSFTSSRSTKPNQDRDHPIWRRRCLHDGAYRDVQIDEVDLIRKVYSSLWYKDCRFFLSIVTYQRLPVTSDSCTMCRLRRTELEECWNAGSTDDFVNDG